MTDGDLEATPLYRKALGCLWGGIIGDAMGTPTENLTYQEVEARFGWVSDFDSDGRSAWAGAEARASGTREVPDGGRGAGYLREPLRTEREHFPARWSQVARTS
jgi:ADP-ribosylglycohydrolase